MNQQIPEPEEVRHRPLAIDGLLRELARTKASSGDAEGFVQSVMEQIRTNSTARESFGDEFAEASSPNSTEAQFHWGWAAAMAACFLVFFGIAMQSLRTGPMAVVADASGEVWVRDASMAAPVRVHSGMRLFSRAEIFTVGSQSGVSIRWQDGSVVNLPGGSRMVLSTERGQKRMELLQGVCEARFQCQSEGKPALLGGPYVNAEIVAAYKWLNETPSHIQLAVMQGQVRLNQVLDASQEMQDDRPSQRPNDKERI